MAKVKKHWKLIVGIIVALVVLGALLGNSDTKEPEDDTKIKVSSSSTHFKGQNYREVEEALIKDGFTNITKTAIEDLITGWLTSDPIN